MSSIVLVHGSFLGPWVWQPVTERLRGAGVPALSVSLPSCASASAALSLRDDVAAVAAAIAQARAPVVLCGHSYGGIPVTVAGLDPAVSHIVYLCAYMPARGESLRDLASGRALGWVEHQAGLAVPDPLRGAVALLGASSGELVPWVAARLRPQATSVYAEDPPQIAWHSVPTSFVLTSRDAVLPTGRQRRMASRADRRLTLTAGHLPQLTCPDELARILLALA